MKDRLVWLSTYHQAMLMCKRINIDQTRIHDALCSKKAPDIWADSTALYRLILQKLEDL